MRYARNGTLHHAGQDVATRGVEDVLNDLPRHPFVPDSLILNYDIVRPGEADRVMRREGAVEGRNIDYTDFSPPALWGAPYSVYLVEFRNYEEEGFMYHSGEELLSPLKGRIRYHFAEMSGEEDEGPYRSELDPPLSPGEIIRINPNRPHHTWAAEKGRPAKAWMAFRHGTEVPSSIAVASGEREGKERRVGAPEVTMEQIQKPGRYPLMAWGIADAVKTYRDRSHLTKAGLAHLTGLDASTITKIEQANYNPSLKALINICTTLSIPLRELIEQSEWDTDRDELPDQPFGNEEWAPQPVLERREDASTRLRCATINLPDGYERGHEPALQNPNSEPLRAEFVTWINLQGRLIVHVTSKNEEAERLVPEGATIHFRHSGHEGAQGEGEKDQAPPVMPTKMEAFGDVRLLQVAYTAGMRDRIPL